MEPACWEGGVITKLTVTELAVELLVVVVVVPVPVVPVVVLVVPVPVDDGRSELVIVRVPEQSGFTVYDPVYCRALKVVVVAFEDAELLEGIATIFPAPLKSR